MRQLNEQEPGVAPAPGAASEDWSQQGYGEEGAASGSNASAGGASAAPGSATMAPGAGFNGGDWGHAGYGELESSGAAGGSPAAEPAPTPAPGAAAEPATEPSATPSAEPADGGYGADDPMKAMQEAIGAGKKP